MKNLEKLKPTQPVKIIKELLRVEFSQDEIKDFGAALARASIEIQDLTNQKKAMSSEFKAKIDAKTAEIESISTKITTGHEYKMVECEEKHNDPNTGMKTIRRKDTGEIVAKKAMKIEEMQLELDVTSIQDETI